MSDDRTEHEHERQRGVALEHALRSLPGVEPDPLWTRATLVAAQRRLAAERPRIGAIVRYEPYVLIALSILQLTWAALRVFAFVR